MFDKMLAACSGKFSSTSYSLGHEIRQKLVHARPINMTMVSKRQGDEAVGGSSRTEEAASPGDDDLLLLLRAFCHHAPVSTEIKLIHLCMYMKIVDISDLEAKRAFVYQL